MEQKMVNNVTLSVIVPVYNGASYVVSLVKCIEKQKYQSMELIFVDDGSVDDTYAVCKELEKQHSWIRVIHTENQGVSHARNTGIEAAKGTWIQFLDVDDAIQEDMFQTFTQVAADHVEVDCIVCGCTRISGERETVNCGPENTIFAEGETLYRLFDQLKMEDRYWLLDYCWNKWYKKSILESYNIRFPQEISLGEDFVFNCRYMKFIKELQLLKDCFYEYRVGDNGLVSRFQKEPWKTRMPLYLAQKELYEQMNLWNKNRTEIEKQYGQILFGDIRTINSKKCFLTGTEKRAYMEAVIQSPFFSMICEYLKSRQSPVFFVYYFVCKTKNKSLLLSLIQLEGILRK